MEIHGNGPFACPRISIGSTSLCIRAASGFRPVICKDPAASKDSMLIHRGQLVLEGLELQNLSPAPLPEYATIITSQGHLHLANCRLVLKDWGMAIAGAGPLRDLRNCEFLGGGNPSELVGWVAPAHGRMRLDNCLSYGGVKVHYRFEDLSDVSIQIRKTTVISRKPLNIAIERLPGSADNAARPPLRFQLTENVLDSSFASVCAWHAPLLKEQAPLSNAEVVALLPPLLDWRGSQNLYPTRGLLAVAVDKGGPVPVEPTVDLEAWRKLFSSPETDSVQGQPRFQGGDLFARASGALEHLRPDDFRLLSGSAGYKAGKDGKDLGADVDLVGPGPAYERWKKTPEYQQWLKDTKQVSGP